MRGRHEVSPLLIDRAGASRVRRKAGLGDGEHPHEKRSLEGAEGGVILLVGCDC